MRFPANILAWKMHYDIILADIIPCPPDMSPAGHAHDSPRNMSAAPPVRSLRSDANRRGIMSDDIIPLNL